MLLAAALTPAAIAASQAREDAIVAVCVALQSGRSLASGLTTVQRERGMTWECRDCVGTVLNRDVSMYGAAVAFVRKVGPARVMAALVPRKVGG